MPDVHVPQLDQHRSHSIWMILLEVALISVGVFLGLMGEQWREARHDRELAEYTLRDFRRELATNRRMLGSVTAYHAAIQQRLRAYLAEPGPKTMDTFRTVGFNGLQNVNFEHTAWDLAVATGALTHIDRELALATSRVYTNQDKYDRQQNGMIDASFSPTAFGRDFPGFVTAVEIYFEGIVQKDPQMVKAYDAVIQQIDRRLARK